MAPTPDWAAWRHDHPTAQHWAPHVAHALNTGLNTRTAAQLVRDYGATQPGPRNGRTDAELAAAALVWLTARGIGQRIPDALTPVLRRIRTDGYLLGAASAAALLDQAPAPLGDWKPGDITTAQNQINTLDGADPAPVLADANQAAQQASDTHLGRIARALALGVIAGHAPTAVAAAMLTIATRDSDGISLTELLLAAGLAVFGAYKRRQIPEVRWVIDPRSKVCPTCLTNSEYGPVRLGQAFPSGHTTTPAHNRCACSLQPA